MGARGRGAGAKAKPKPEPAPKDQPPPKRRRKKAGEGELPIEQLPPEQVAKYQNQWEKFGLQAKKDKGTDTKINKPEEATVEKDQPAQSSGSGGGNPEVVKVEVAVEQPDVDQQKCKTNADDEKEKDVNQKDEKDSLRDDLSQMVVEALATTTTTTEDDVKHAQEHARFPVYTCVAELRLNHKPFSNPNSYVADLADFNSWLEKDKQETLTYKAIMNEAVGSTLWSDYVSEQTSEEIGADPLMYKEIEKLGDDVDFQEETSQWVRFVRKTSGDREKLLASGGPTNAFMNNIKDAMPESIRDHHLLDKFCLENTGSFTLLKNVSADATEFLAWIESHAGENSNENDEVPNKDDDEKTCDAEEEKPCDAETESLNSGPGGVDDGCDDDSAGLEGMYDQVYQKPPSTMTHPDINAVLESAIKVMLTRAGQRVPDLAERIRAIPGDIHIADLFSGTGCFHKAATALFKAIQYQYPSESSHFEVSNDFMCEHVGFKQRFLLQAFRDDSCIFDEATTMFNENRMCKRHNKKCDLPHELLTLGAGFSCKSYSRLNPEFQQNQRAMANMDEEQSSVLTFKCVTETIETIQCRTFLLENVDLEEPKASGDTNLQLILEALKNLSGGYHLKVYKVLSSDFGVPQRRIRLFFLGVSKRFYPEFTFQKVTKHLEAFKLHSQNPDAFLIPDHDDIVTAELHRREARRTKADSAEQRKKKTKDKAEKDLQGEHNADDNVVEVDKSSKWKEQHMLIAETRSIGWPLSVPKDLDTNAWYQTLSDREKEVVLFLLNDKKTQQVSGQVQPVRYGDVYHSASRTPSSSEIELPTILPSSKIWDLISGRLLLGRELLHMQALQYPEEVLSQFTEAQLTDLAGNAMTSTIVAGILLACLLELPHATESELEEEQGAEAALATLKRMRR